MVKLTCEEEDWIKLQRFSSLQNLADQINAHLKRSDITRSWVQTFRRRHNLTGKPGVMGDTRKYPYRTYRNREGYLVRIIDRKHIPLHRLEWERVNGPIPPKHGLVCLGEKEDTTPENWFLASDDIRGYLSIGRRKLANLPPELHEAAIAIARLKARFGFKSDGERTRPRRASVSKEAP